MASRPRASRTQARALRFRGAQPLRWRSMSRASLLAFAGMALYCLAPASAAAAVGFPLEQTDVQVHVTGPVAELTIRQVFRNPYDRSIEATYVFPLHEDAAVDAAAMRIGDREIQARIHTREEAREI